jgi:C-terminal processing protease CtpA/Prc
VPADRVFEVDLGAGVAARVPMVLYADQDGTLPRAPQGARPPAPAKPEGFRPGGTDRTTRLAGVTLAWTVFQHFYPYFDVVEGDWDAELRRALRSAATDASLWDYQVTLRRLVAALGDGHGNVFHPETATPFELPVSWEWLERRLVVTGLAAEVPPGIAVGDVVLEVDGVPAGEALDRLAEETSASAPGFEAHRAASDLAARGGDEVVLRLESAGGETRVVTLPRRHSRSEPILSEPRPEPIVELEDGIEYVDLTRVSDEDLAESWDRLAAARGVVFDLRGYPAVGTATLSHLTDQPVSSAQWHVPAVTRPDRLEMAFEQSSWDLEPEAPRIRGKVAFLTDARAISYAETFLGIVEHYRLGEIVGSPTAGTNGNVNSIELPGGYRVRWTGMKVLKHDGSRHHGVGILPTVPASRTLQGIRAGRDEVLERGLEVVAGGG